MSRGWLLGIEIREVKLKSKIEQFPARVPETTVWVTPFWETMESTRIQQPRLVTRCGSKSPALSDGVRAASVQLQAYYEYRLHYQNNKESVACPAKIPFIHVEAQSPGQASVGLEKARLLAYRFLSSSCILTG